MQTNLTPRRGLALAFLLLSLTSCASNPQNVRTETVTVERPVVVAVPKELTEVPAEPVLPAGELANEDLAEGYEAMKAWGRGLAKQLREIAGLPLEADNARAE